MPATSSSAAAGLRPVADPRPPGQVHALYDYLWNETVAGRLFAGADVPQLLAPVLFAGAAPVRLLPRLRTLAAAADPAAPAEGAGESVAVSLR